MTSIISPQLHALGQLARVEQYFKVATDAAINLQIDSPVTRPTDPVPVQAAWFIPPTSYSDVLQPALDGLKLLHNTSQIQGLGDSVYTALDNARNQVIEGLKILETPARGTSRNYMIAGAMEAANSWVSSAQAMIRETTGTVEPKPMVASAQQ